MKPKTIELRDNSLHSLHCNPGDTWNQRPIIPVNSCKSIDFNALTLLASELVSKLHEKEFIEKNLHLFGENYEHNTNDNLLNILGLNDDNYKIETGNLVGYISTKNVRVTISSRFGDDFLKYLLCQCEGFLEVPDSASIGQTGLFEWVMVYLWKNALKRAYRLGIPKQYISKHEKIFSIKGNVDILNYSVYHGKDGRTLCHYYQYDYNNPVTQLISKTFSTISQKKLVEDIIALKNVFETCVEGGKTSLEKALSTRPLSNPYYAEYNRSISLSKNILRRRYSDITDTSIISSAFLFDMSMLFEHFIRKVLINNGLDLFPKNNESMTISRGLGINNDRHLYPDIVINRGQGNNGKIDIEVYDVKYKHFDTRYGIKREDLFQLHTYVLYLSNDYNVQSCGIIYPQSENVIADTESLILHPYYSNGIPLHVFFLNIPSPSENFKTEMDESKRLFIRKFNNIAHSKLK